MKKMEQLYEGKAKKVFATDDPDVVIVDYKDDATAFNGEKKGTIVGKGVINNRMTNHVFKLLEKEGVPTHLIEEYSPGKSATSFILRFNAGYRMPLTKLDLPEPETPVTAVRTFKGKRASTPFRLFMRQPFSRMLWFHCLRDEGTLIFSSPARYFTV